jgi:phosphoglycerol transferase MdoB-like AlkP superfamily enzyme
MNNNNPRNRDFSALSPLLSFAWRLLLATMVARVLLVAWQWDRVVEAGMLVPVFLQGLRFDLVTLGIVSVVPVLAFPLLASNDRLIPVWRALLQVYLPVMLVLIVFMEFSTPSFINQFDSRPNILFVEYLKYPKEVAATLWAAYKAPLLIAVACVSALAVVSVRQFNNLLRVTKATGVLRAAWIFPCLLILCLGMVRSTLDHRPVNPSTVALSSDPMVNDLALNSTYTVLYAIYEQRYESSGGFRYSDMTDQQAIDEVRRSMGISAADFTSDSLPTMHLQRSTRHFDKPKNLVIIIEESLGAEFVGSMGGLPLTPHLDALSGEGIWLKNLYATGTRSVRGLEAVVSGFTPTPAKSVVKMPKSQRNFFTLAGLLGQHGYATSFIYGGEAQFDNMRRFFMNNGFQFVVDEKDYENPVFVGSWGVSDEDLFSRAHEEFEKKGSDPFFSVVFTSTNHSPFQYPAGRIEPYDEETNTVNNAVKYADYALGQFFEKAKASSYWDSTVFLVVADHNSRVYGNELVPVQRFHIPGLILGGSIEPAEIERIASQIDLGPTLLSLIGIDSEHPMIGRDLSATAEATDPGRAIMQFNSTQAYLEGNRLVVMQKDLPAVIFQYENGHIAESSEHDETLVTRALAHSVWSSLAYQNSLYRLPPKDLDGN